MATCTRSTVPCPGGICTFSRTPGRHQPATRSQRNSRVSGYQVIHVLRITAAGGGVTWRTLNLNHLHTSMSSSEELWHVHLWKLTLTEDEVGWATAWTAGTPACSCVPEDSVLKRLWGNGWKIDKPVLTPFSTFLVSCVNFILKRASVKKTKSLNFWVFYIPKYRGSNYIH